MSRYFKSNDDETINSFIAVHPLKADIPIESTESGIDIFSKAEHPSKALHPIVFKEEGMTKDTRVKEEQAPKQCLPKETTDFGITILTREEHSLNA